MPAVRRESTAVLHFMVAVLNECNPYGLHGWRAQPESASWQHRTVRGSRLRASALAPTAATSGCREVVAPVIGRRQQPATCVMHQNDFRGCQTNLACTGGTRRPMIRVWLRLVVPRRNVVPERIVERDRSCRAEAAASDQRQLHRCSAALRRSSGSLSALWRLLPPMCRRRQVRSTRWSEIVQLSPQSQTDGRNWPMTSALLLPESGVPLPCN